MQASQKHSPGHEDAAVRQLHRRHACAATAMANHKQQTMISNQARGARQNRDCAHAHAPHLPTGRTRLACHWPVVRSSLHPHTHAQHTNEDERVRAKPKQCRVVFFSPVGARQRLVLLVAAAKHVDGAVRARHRRALRRHHRQPPGLRPTASGRATTSGVIATRTRNRGVLGSSRDGRVGPVLDEPVLARRIHQHGPELQQNTREIELGTRSTKRQGTVCLAPLGSLASRSPF